MDGHQLGLTVRPVREGESRLPPDNWPGGNNAVAHSVRATIDSPATPQLAA